MKISKAKEMKRIDEYCIEDIGIPGIVLMENAAIKVIRNIDFKKYKSFSIVCGIGNNGGDGFAVARHLLSLDKTLHIFVVGYDEIRKRMSGDCAVNYNSLKNLGADIINVNTQSDVEVMKEAIKNSDMVVDALFGTGISRKIEGIQDRVITAVNENSKYIIAVDVPSGFESDTGEILGNCVKASMTVTFESYKRGFLKYGSQEYTGKVIVENIGIPKPTVEKFSCGEFLIDREYFRTNISSRNKYANKGNFGHVTLVCGSRGYTGAAYISTMGAVKSGAGLVTLCCSPEIQDVLSSKLSEAMTVSFEYDKFNQIIKKSTVVAAGPGLGNNEHTYDIIHNIIENCTCPIVIDADGLNVLSGKLSLLKMRKGKTIFTPHPGEFSRLSGFSIEEINENRLDIAKKFAKQYNVILLLKGYNTVITDGKIAAVNTTGSSAMASGGMGDCLTGIIASFIGQGYSPFKAACLAAYIHGYCGDKLSKKMYSVTATDVFNEIPYAIKELINS